jgi:hydroxyethylthiazole kinase-like sugar kinase family protein
MQDARRIYELMVLTAWADGKVQAEEALAVHRIVAADPAFAQVGNKSEISRAIQKRISEKGLDASLREAASAIAEADRELAFRCCARVLSADGDLAVEDAQVLDTLQELFSLSGEAVKRLMRDRNR